jgi:antitoxin CptB
MLEISDPDLYNWFSGREPVPSAEDTAVMRLFLAHRFA